LSQAGLGWELINKHYDDGGISGGHMEREGLQELLNDIRVGRVDVVVVYKVDRLTRSITDFGRLVEAFDSKEVSFVSVTQAFNTTNSMGRLTLNVLLSFAQFEREVTAERIRDKIASSKQKGMWMGGRVPFGYRNENKQLFFEPEEARTIRLIFELYLALRNVRMVKEELSRRNIISRKYTNKSGDRVGGTPFTRGNVASILANPVYRGKIKHKDKVYPGNHEAIIERDIWEQVQAIMAGRAVKRYTVKNTASPALFTGLLYDHYDRKLIPHHVNKKGKKYYYYVSQQLQGQAECAENKVNVRMPMWKLDDLINNIVLETLKCKSALLDCLHLETQSAEQISELTAAATILVRQLNDSIPGKRREFYQQIVERVTIHSDRIEIVLKPEGLAEHLNITLNNEAEYTIEKPMNIRRRGQEMKLVIGGIKQKGNNIDSALTKLIAKAHQLKTELESGKVCSIKEFAVMHNLDHGDAKNLIPLAYLAPSIIEDILAGHQPAELTAVRMKEIVRHLPHLWSEQRRLLGFPA
jgi:DNA invertase Pin-like site-specific DNA recombinase